MQNHKDNFQAYDENSLFEIAIISVLGDREEQQDSVGYEIKPDEGLVVICDGMGGHDGGKLASSIAVDILTRKYLEEYPTHNIQSVLIDTVEEVDRRIASLTDDFGKPLQAGSTLVATFIRGKTLHWVSVGDSRIYLYRNGELVQATEDHVYQTLLDEKKEQGLIDELEYQNKSQQGEALISFLGVNGLPKLDTNDNPFTVIKDDKILLMSDGLYKLVTNNEIMRILSNFTNIEDALKALELKAQKASKYLRINRDNMTVALLRIK